jgi:hypothetical protein
MNLSICHSIECVSCIGRRFIKTKILLLHSNLDVSAENKAYIRCLAYHDIKCDYKFSNTTSRENLILIFNHFHHRGRNLAVSMPVASPDKGGAFDGRGADTAVCKNKKTKETNHER